MKQNRSAHRSPPLHFRRLQLRNWRNFVEVDVPLASRAFLLGPNAAGKSNLLDAFRFLRDLVADGGGLQEAVRRRGGVSSIRSLAARRQSEIAVEVRLASGEKGDVWDYRLEFTLDKTKRVVVKQEKVAKAGEMLLERPNDHDRKDPARLTQTHLEQVFANERFRPLADAFRGIQYLHIVPQLVREPERAASQGHDPFGGNFLEQIASTGEKTRNARLSRICKALRVAVPQLESLELWRDARGAPHLRGKYEHWHPQGAWQTE